jgi:hypothetical protein
MNNFNNQRVWVYQADRLLGEPDKLFINYKLQDFIQNWQAHGVQLTASYEIIENRFIVLKVENGFEEASGCSIDKSVAVIMEIGNKLTIDFFNRLQIAYKTKQGDINTFHVSELQNLLSSGQITAETIIYNNSVTNNEEYETTWQITIANSWLGSRIRLITV